MNVAIRGLILGVCAIGVAQVAAAASPKVSLTTDDKDARVVQLFITSPDDQVTYRCQYVWQITFKNSAETTDHCEVDVAPGTKNAMLCTQKYDLRISQLRMVQQRCTGV